MEILGRGGARRCLLLASAGAILGTGVLFWALRERLPYGHWAPWALGVAGVGTGAMMASLWRLERLARRALVPRALVLAVEKIPRKAGHTYLGEGFVWGPREARLLLELSEAGARAVVEGAGDWLIHGVGAGRSGPLFLPDSLLNQHVFLLGAPGAGKTRGLELLVEQAIGRGDAVVVVDPKGDEGLLDRTYDAAARHGRAGDFRLLALPYPFQSVRYNPLADYVSPSDIADRIAAILPKRGDSEAFRNFAWKFVATVAAGIDLLGEPMTLAKIENYAIHNTWLLARRMMKKLCPDLFQKPDLHETLDDYRAYCVRKGRSFPELDAVIEMARLDREYFGKVAGSLGTVLSKLAGRTVGYLLCPGDVAPPEGVAEAPVLSWRTIDNDRLVVYFFLGSLIGPDSANATARMALADLMSYVGKKYAYEEASALARSRLTVVVDEVADAVAPETVNILNKARGAGLSLVMAGQSLADLEVALGGAAEARRALANVGTFLALRAANPEDAQYFSDKAGLRPLPVVTRGEQYEPALFGSGRAHVADFAYRASVSMTSRSDPVLPTAALDRMAPFHFFGLWAGEIHKGVLPVLEPPRRLLSPSLKGARGA
jgi:conjugal transfer pilus assembly protein TraD